MKTSSAASSFYSLMSRVNCRCPYLLHKRAMAICSKYNLNKIKVWTSRDYIYTVKDRILRMNFNEEDGIVDSVSSLLRNRSERNMNILRLLLKAF